MLFYFLMHILLQSLDIVTAANYTYDLICPHTSQWMLRALEQKCVNKTTYHCLHDTNGNKWIEECLKPNDFTPGNPVTYISTIDVSNKKYFR